MNRPSGVLWLSVLSGSLLSCGSLSGRTNTSSLNRKRDAGATAAANAEDGATKTCPTPSTLPNTPGAGEGALSPDGRALAPDFFKVVRAKCIACHSGLYLPNLAADADILAQTPAIQAAVAKLTMPPSPGSTTAQEREIIAAGPYVTVPAGTQPPTPQPIPPTEEFVALVNARCTPCHNAGTKPKLVTQSEILNLKIAIQGAVALGSMPPAPSVLSAEEKKIILRGTTEDVTNKVPNSIGGTDARSKFITAVAGKCSFCHNGSVPPRLLSEAEILNKPGESQQEVIKNEMPRQPTTLTAEQRKDILDFNPAAPVAGPALALTGPAPAQPSGSQSTNCP